MLFKFFVLLFDLGLRMGEGGEEELEHYFQRSSLVLCTGSVFFLCALNIRGISSVAWQTKMLGGHG